MQTEKKQQKYQQKVNEDTPKFPVSTDEHPIYARKEFTKCKQKKKEEKKRAYELLLRPRKQSDMWS